MKILGMIAALLAVAVAAILGFAATKPDTMTVSRSIMVEAPAEQIYPHIADFRQWESWSPWEKRDPQMTRTYSGADSGIGAVYEWLGNDDVGQGRMNIIDAGAPSRVNIQLDFIKPFESSFETEFRLADQEGVTRVTWTMQGANTYLSKLMSVFMDMESMIGRDFEQGLQSLKMAAERLEVEP